MKSNTLTIVMTTLILLGGGYWYVTNKSGNQLPLTATLPSENAAETQFQILVGQLSPIVFATDIFSDPRFMSLVSLTTPVTPEPGGRLDPFAPLSAGAASSGTVTGG